MAIALVNELNYERALLLPEDRKNQVMFEKLDIREGSEVAMIGTVPIEKENVLKAVRHGAGTPVIQKFSRKTFLLLSELRTNQIKKR